MFLLRAPLANRTPERCSAIAFGALPRSAAAQLTTTSRGARDELTLWYTQAAGQRTEAPPIGNGRIGAMIFGGATEECLQLNEDTLWAGGPYDPANPEALRLCRKCVCTEVRSRPADEPKRFDRIYRMNRISEIDPSGIRHLLHPAILLILFILSKSL